MTSSATSVVKQADQLLLIDSEDVFELRLYIRLRRRRVIGHFFLLFFFDEDRFWLFLRGLL